MHVSNAQLIASEVQPVKEKRPTPAKLKFHGSDRFLRELRKRVDAYFEKTGRKRRDCPQMYFKTATIFAWFFAMTTPPAKWSASTAGLWMRRGRT